MSHSNQVSLEDVLDAFLADAPEATPKQVAAWIGRYPQFQRELTEFAASLGAMRHQPAAADAVEREDELFALGQDVLRDLLPTRQESPLADLVTYAQARGVSARDLAARLGLSVPIVMKLHRRLLRAESLPQELIEALAKVLGTSQRRVFEYLQQPPALAVGAHYRAEQAPVLGEQQDFAAAVRTDRSLSEEDRARWLAVATSETES